MLYLLPVFLNLTPVIIAVFHIIISYSVCATDYSIAIFGAGVNSGSYVNGDLTEVGGRVRNGPCPVW